MKFSKKYPDRGYLHERTEFSPLEKEFADRWESEQLLGSSGFGLLQQLFAKGPLGMNGVVLTMNARDRYVAATVIQWLGSNVGIGFVSSCLRAEDYIIVKSIGDLKPKPAFSESPSRDVPTTTPRLVKLNE